MSRDDGTAALESEKQAATRGVESFEALSPQNRLVEATALYNHLFSLTPWGDTSPSILPSAAVIKLWGGWDTHRSLMSRLQAAREEAMIKAGRGSSGQSVSTLAARQTILQPGDALLAVNPLAWSLWADTPESRAFNEGLGQGAGTLARGRIGIPDPYGQASLRSDFYGIDVPGGAAGRFSGDGSPGGGDLEEGWTLTQAALLILGVLGIVAVVYVAQALPALAKTARFMAAR